ncbi:MAG: hypothetical protein ACT4OX_05695 [Actinomycetota bacterium]
MRAKATNQIVEAVRNELDSLRSSIGPMVENAVSHVRNELDSARREGHAALERQILPTIDDLRQALSLRDPQLVEALERIAEAQQRLADQLEADRRERAGLRDVLALLAERLQPPEIPAPVSAVIGGAIPATTMLMLTDAEQEDRNGHEDLRLAVEVRGRFGDRWAEGFEIADVVDDERGRRYLLRRLSDGHVIPTYFEERDVRPVVRGAR